MLRAGLLGLALVGAPAGAAGPTPFQVLPTTTGEFAIPIHSVIDRKFAGVVRQRYDFSCGSAALATLLRYHYGRAVREDDVFRGMWAEGDRPMIRRVGFSLLDMKRYLTAHGLHADGFRVPLAKIAEVGLPGIALISVRKYKHFVVVKGIAADRVLIGDPSTGLRVMTRKAFESAWNGVYFALANEEAFGRLRFNRRGEWTLVSAMAPSTRFTEPPSVQALELTQPFYRDF